jgi:hypothetical protein
MLVRRLKAKVGGSENARIDRAMPGTGLMLGQDTKEFFRAR